MRRTLSAAVRGTVRAAMVFFGLLSIVCTGQQPAHAIEMFTYFGDGSRIGLPSLEVPIEAYPGIPLRSDRIRARRRAQQAAGTAVRSAPPGGVTIRAMPQPVAKPQAR